jgi:hypothetical protein
LYSMLISLAKENSYPAAFTGVVSQSSALLLISRGVDIPPPCEKSWALIRPKMLHTKRLCATIRHFGNHCANV